MNESKSSLSTDQVFENILIDYQNEWGVYVNGKRITLQMFGLESIKKNEVVRAARRETRTTSFVNEEGVIPLSLEEEPKDSQLRSNTKMIIMLQSIVIVLFISGNAFGVYHEKTRFDRAVVSEEELQTLNEEFAEPTTFIDYAMRYVAHKDVQASMCYLEKMREDHWKSIITGKLRPRTLYPSSLSLTNVEAWKLAGGRVVDFCDGYSIKLLQETRPIPANAQDPFLNEIPLDENDVIQKRVTDVVLTPLLSRAKREIMLENRERMNQQFVRMPRQTHRHGGKFRGQTQSQYLHHGGEGSKEGKAEAEATDQSSRALVSGTNGMGQAQSMSSGGSGCEDCIGYPGSYGPGGVGVGPSTAVPSYPSAMIPGSPGSYPSGLFPPPGTVSIPGNIPSGVSPGIGPGTFQPSYPPGSGPGATMYPSGVQQPGLTIPGSGPGLQTTYPGTAGGGFPPSGVPGVSGTYPSGVQQPGMTGGGTGWSTTYPAGVQPGGVPGSFPGGSQQPIATGGGPGISTTYPGSAQPSGVPAGSGTYPGGVQPTGVPGVSGTYPGGVQPSGVPGVSGTYPSGVQHPIVAGGGPGVSTTYPGIVPGGGVPGASGTYPGVSQQPIVTGGGPGLSTTFPGSAQPIGIPSVTGTYPSGVQQPGVTGGGIGSPTTYPGSAQPGGVPGISGTYPISGQPPIVTGGGSGLPTTYPGGIQPSGLPGSYSSGQQPSVIYPGTPGSHPQGAQLPSGTIPGQYPVGGQGGPVYYPSGVLQPGTSPAGTPSYPGHGQQPGGGGPGGVSGVPGSYPMNVQQPGQQQYPAGGTNIPGNYPPTGIQQPGSTIPTSYPGTPGTYPSFGQQPGLPIPGQQQYPSPGTNVPGSYPTTGIQQPSTIIPGSTPGVPGTYPISVPQSGGTIPGQQYPVGGGNIPYPGTQQPGVSFPGQQQYPPGGNIQGTYPVGQQPGTVTSGAPGIYPGIGGIPGLSPGMYPGMTGVPGAVYPGGQTQQPGYPVYSPGTVIGTAGVVDDGADSHASSSVKQSDSGTQASASSDGKFGSGTAQSQVSGTYSGSGSFSAQAGTSDGNRGAQTQISGGKEGAMSNAQGMGGQGKSQAQVQLNSDTGATMTGAQSAGLNHGTNSQVQASAKGGMADAQANGEGNTSSQAQIGFQPYTGSKENEKSRSKPFRGGGQASAQSGTYRGQSQSQIDGSFQYGITYTGAAQAGSGAGAGASRKPFNFTNSDPNLFKSFEKFDPLTISKNDEATTVSSDLDTSNAEESNLKTGSSSRRTIIVRPQTRQEEAFDPIHDDQSYGPEIEEYEEEEYVDEDYDGPTSSRVSSDMVKTRSLDEAPKQIQMINIGNEKKHNIHVIQDSSRPKVGDILQPGHALPGYTIPPGFRGRVTSVSGDRTQAYGNGKSQAQTVSLAPSSQGRIQVGKSVYPETRSLKSSHERGSTSNGDVSKKHHPSTRQMNGSSTRSSDVSPVKSNYFTVTKSVAGKLGDPRQKYEHRYYTKSSTCGYFTFSCNIVHGSNGRTKICKPKMPTYPDGTPMKC